MSHLPSSNSQGCESCCASRLNRKSRPSLKVRKRWRGTRVNSTRGRMLEKVRLKKATDILMSLRSRLKLGETGRRLCSCNGFSHSHREASGFLVFPSLPSMVVHCQKLRRNRIWLDYTSVSNRIQRRQNIGVTGLRSDVQLAGECGSLLASVCLMCLRDCYRARFPVFDRLLREVPISVHEFGRGGTAHAFASVVRLAQDGRVRPGAVVR